MRPEQADQKVANPKTQVSIRPHGESQIRKLAKRTSSLPAGPAAVVAPARGGDEVLGEERSRAACDGDGQMGDVDGAASMGRLR